MKKERKLFGVSELARRIKLDPKTVRKYINNGLIKIASINPSTGFMVFTQKQVDDYESLMQGNVIPNQIKSIRNRVLN